MLKKLMLLLIVMLTVGGSVVAMEGGQRLSVAQHSDNFRTRQLEARAAGNLAEAKLIARIIEQLDNVVSGTSAIVPLHSASVDMATLIRDTEFIDSIKFYDLTRASRR